MAKFRGQRHAFGQPGIEPRWTQGNKDGVGTAYSSSSRIWFTVWNGVLTEVYYPTIDKPQIRDLQYLVSDGKSFFHEEKRHLLSKTERCTPNALSYRVTNTDPDGRYQITKEVISDPHLPCILQHTRVQAAPELLSQLHFYALCAPHLEVGGWKNNAYVVETSGREILVANHGETWLALMATVPFRRVSCGYVGHSDGWTDLADNFQMDWVFDQALDGNVALTGELQLDDREEFTLGLALGEGMHNAIATLFQALGIPFSEKRDRYVDQWTRTTRRNLPLERVAGDGGNLYQSSVSLLLAHEDKSFPGALIASMSIPWGESKGDDDIGGYHLVWPRDMVNSSTGLLAAGHTSTALRTLIYLATSQLEDGGFPQNYWINGQAHWHGVQLDQVSFPILMAYRLREANALADFDPYVMVMRAARYLVIQGPATEQERWEEAGGYSPSSLASNIAAMFCAAAFAHERGDHGTAKFLEEYADFVEGHVEDWTVTTQGTLVPGVPKHYIRITPPLVSDLMAGEDPNNGRLVVANRPPGGPFEFPAKDIVDAGFLELVRYGIRKPGDSLIEDSLQVVDQVLKVETPFGPCWRRYNHDGYGQRPDGSSYEGWGQGRAWPLLTGERAHYELAAGRDTSHLIRAMEGFASSTGLLPEQIWDTHDLPGTHMFLGRPTGSAMPLMWAHGEYVKLLRSEFDRRVFDLLPSIYEHYVVNRKTCRRLEVWKKSRQARTVRLGHTLRVQRPASFRLHWTRDEWQTAEDTLSTPTGLGVEYVDIPIAMDQQAPIRFTFYCTATDRWEGQDFMVRAV
jgi:glucoamylase